MTLFESSVEMVAPEGALVMEPGVRKKEDPEAVPPVISLQNVKKDYSLLVPSAGRRARPLRI